MLNPNTVTLGLTFLTGALMFNSASICQSNPTLLFSLVLLTYCGFWSSSCNLTHLNLCLVFPVGGMYAGFGSISDGRQNEQTELAGVRSVPLWDFFTRGTQNILFQK